MSRVAGNRFTPEAIKRIENNINNHNAMRERFALNYAYLTGCSQREAEDIYDEAEARGINTDSITQMISLGYEHKDVQSIIKRESAPEVIYAIATYGVRKFEKNKSSDTIGHSDVLSC